MRLPEFIYIEGERMVRTLDILSASDSPCRDVFHIELLDGCLYTFNGTLGDWLGTVSNCLCDDDSRINVWYMSPVDK